MDYITQLQKLADKLDSQGFVKQANLIDKALISLAQATPLPDPSAKEVEQIPTQMDLEVGQDLEVKQKSSDINHKMSRTAFLMLSELRDFYVRNLSDFEYFGNDNIKTIQSAIDQLVTMYRVLLRNITADYDKDAVATYEAYLKKLQTEVDRSKKMKITPTKVKVDKFLLYNNFEILLKKIERLYDKGLKELKPVLRKARAVRDAFANVIQQTSEQIAHADLIETS